MTPKNDPTTIPATVPIWLAILPDSGPASVGDGCGLLVSVGEDVGDGPELDDIETVVMMIDEEVFVSGAEVERDCVEEGTRRLVLVGVDKADDLLWVDLTTEAIEGVV